jgi:hypothetical protein
LPDERRIEKGFVEPGVPARSKKIQKKTEVRSEAFILCGVVTVTFRVSALFVVTKCYSYSKMENVIISCSSVWRTSSKSTHGTKPTSQVTNTRDNMKMDHEEVEWGVDRIHVAKDRVQWWILVDIIMNFDSITGGIFLSN